MNILHPSVLLRRALLLDAGVSGANAALMAGGAGLLAPLLGLPAGLLLPTGLALLPYVALLLWLATREAVPRGAVVFVIACNLLWAIDCALLLAMQWAAPTPLGEAYVALHIVAVLGFAALQWMGLQRSALQAR